MNLSYSLYCLYRTFFSAYHTSLAVIIIRIWKTVIIYGDTAIRTSYETGHTFGANIVIPDRFKYTPVTGFLIAVFVVVFMAGLEITAASNGIVKMGLLCRRLQ